MFAPCPLLQAGNHQGYNNIPFHCLAGGFSVFAGVGERTREGNDLYREMIESGALCCAAHAVLRCVVAYRAALCLLCCAVLWQCVLLRCGGCTRQGSTFVCSQLQCMPFVTPPCSSLPACLLPLTACRRRHQAWRAAGGLQGDAGVRPDERAPW